MIAIMSYVDVLMRKKKKLGNSIALVWLALVISFLSSNRQRNTY